MEKQDGKWQPEDQGVLTLDELASALKTQPSWVYSQTRKKGPDKIPGFKAGKYWRFFLPEVINWLRRQHEKIEG